MTDTTTKKEICIPTMLTINETAERTGISYEALRKGCINGTIVHIKSGNRYLINLEKLIQKLNGEED